MCAFLLFARHIESLETWNPPRTIFIVISFNRFKKIMFLQKVLRKSLANLLDNTRPTINKIYTPIFKINVISTDYLSYS